MIETVAGYARESGQLDTARIDAMLATLKRSLVEGNYLAVAPQFLVTATASTADTTACARRGCRNDRSLTQGCLQKHQLCGEGLMLRAERTWRGRYLRVPALRH
jgi:hypothetical protein